MAEIIKMVLGAVYVVYGHEMFELRKFNSVFNSTTFCKPEGGLWACRDTAEYGWVDFCRAESFHEETLDTYFKFVLNKGTRVCVINSYGDLLSLPCIENSQIGKKLVDWEKLSESYDVVFLTDNGQGETRFSHPMDLYGWDFETLLVLNPDVVTPFNPKEERIMDNENAYYCRLAIELKLVTTSTEFWTKVRASGLTARVWIRMANSKNPNWDNLDNPGWERYLPDGDDEALYNVEEVLFENNSD